MDVHVVINDDKTDVKILDPISGELKTLITVKRQSEGSKLFWPGPGELRKMVYSAVKNKSLALHILNFVAAELGVVPRDQMISYAGNVRSKVFGQTIEQTARAEKSSGFELEAVTETAEEEKAPVPELASKPLLPPVAPIPQRFPKLAQIIS